MEYERVLVEHVGLADPYSSEGVVVLRTTEGKEFHMRAFSGEVAVLIAGFLERESDELPTLYRMIGEVCEYAGLFPAKVRIYESGQALRSNIYLEGKEDVMLRNYRASDALAFAVYYDVPIWVRGDLLRHPE